MTKRPFPSLAWMAFWLSFAVYAWCEHTQYMAGNETLLFRHKTPEEIRIREATVEKLEAQAKKANP